MASSFAPVASVALAGDWTAPPVVLTAAALALALFAQGFARLRRRGRTDLASWSRAGLFAAGLALGVLPLVSPVDAAGDDYLLSAHMLQHVLIADASPLLLLLALRGPLVFFLVPPPLLRALAPVRALRALLRGLLRPGVSFSLWVVVMLGWHVPKLYDSTLAHPLVHDLEHASFVIVGLLVWTQLVDPARHERLTRVRRILFAFGLLALGHPVIDGLLFSGGVAYAPYAVQPHRLFGLSPVLDQRLAGLVMLVEQLLTFGSCIGILLWPMLGDRHRRTLPIEVGTL